MSASQPAGGLAIGDFFRDLFDNAGDVMYTADLDGVITAVNRAAERLTGYSRDELVGSSLARLVAPESFAEAMRMMDPEAPGAESLTYELEIITKDDRRLSIEARSRFLRREGAAVGVHVIARDSSYARPVNSSAHRRALRTEAINEIIAAADASPDLARVIEIAADRIPAVVDGAAAGIWLGGHRTVRGLAADAGPVMLEALRGGGWTVAAPHVAEDWTSVSADETASVPWRRFGVRASVVLPIMSQDACAGVLLAASACARAWTSDDVAFLAEVARQIGATAEGLRLFRESRQRADLMERLVGLQTALHSPMLVAGVAAEIGAGALRLSSADRAAVYLHRSDGTIVCAWRHGLSEAHVAAMVGPEAAPPWRARTGRAARTGSLAAPRMTRGTHHSAIAAAAGAHGTVSAEPLFVPEVQVLGPDDIVRRLCEPEGIRAVAAWPLVYEGRVIASAVCYYDAPRGWSKPEREVFQTFVWQAAAALENARLFEVQRARTAELEAVSASLDQSYMQIVLALARAVDARNAYTADHSERLAGWAEQVARRLGCGQEEILDLRWAALLHDIGKIGVPDEILSKPGPLSPGEWRTMRLHPVIGERILLPLERMRRVATIVRHHQERWDGSGYPDGLRGTAIPLLARVLAVVDAYSAIIDERPYKRARTHHDALRELERCAGRMFDPRAVAAFRAVLADSAWVPAAAGGVPAPQASAR
jgi:PAS domain S-box-containing protein